MAVSGTHSVPRRSPRLASFILVVALGLTASSTIPSLAAPRPTNGRIVFAGDVGQGTQLYSMRWRDGLGVKKLTNLPLGSTTEFPAVSPDGSTIVFGNDKTGDFEIYTVRIDGTHLRRITRDPDLQDTTPSFSPDGSKIVFTRLDDFGAGIAVMDVDGSNIEQLTPVTSSDFKPSFTPDGQTIVFESQRGGLISAIWSMDADGTHARRLTPPQLRAGGPDISQDGQQIVFFNNENYPGKNSLYIMNIDGSGRTRLSNPGGFHHDVWPTFSPDGGYIVFASTRGNPSLCCVDVWRVDVDGSNAIPLTPNVALSGCENSNCVYPTWKVAS